jgi:hypothetical protein
MKPVAIPDEDRLEAIERIDREWSWHRDSGLRMRSLHGKTKLKKAWNHWLFEVTDGRFSVFLAFESWPTFFPVLRQALPIFEESFPVGDVRFGHWYEVEGLEKTTVVEITGLYPLRGKFDGIPYDLDIAQLGECLTA